MNQPSIVTCALCVPGLKINAQATSTPTGTAPAYINSQASWVSHSLYYSSCMRQRTNRDALYFGMWVLYRKVVQGKHAVEWFGEKEDLGSRQ